MPLDFRDQNFGCEIEMTGITRQQAAEAVAALFGTSTRQTHESHIYDPWEVEDADGKKWRFVYDGSIQGHPARWPETATGPRIVLQSGAEFART